MVMEMFGFICPVCKKPLARGEKSYVCVNRHCFDISKKGTVNLLISNKSRHGDDSVMVNARKAFLDKGYYLPLLKAVQQAVLSYAAEGAGIVDCGCGECWYTAGIYEYLRAAGIKPEIIGIDVSKEAISKGASRSRELSLAVASVYDIPVSGGSTDIVMSFFAPFSGAEYLRILKDGGIYITAFPLEDHLYELKAAVYDHPYMNTVSDMEIDGFTLISQQDIRFTFTLETNEDITALFSMTPYMYKTSVQDRKKLEAVNSLKTTASFRLAAYKKL